MHGLYDRDPSRVPKYHTTIRVDDDRPAWKYRCSLLKTKVEANKE